MTAAKINHTPINPGSRPFNASAIHYSDPPRTAAHLSLQEALILAVQPAPTHLTTFVSGKKNRSQTKQTKSILYLAPFLLPHYPIQPKQLSSRLQQTLDNTGI